MKITTEMERDYVEGGGSKCLVCKSGNVEADRVDIDGAQGYANANCPDCKATWVDRYQLVGIDSLEGEDE